MQLTVSARSSNLVLIRFIVLEILRFFYFAVLAWKYLFTPILGRGFWAYFPQMTSSTVITRSSGSTWACSREKRTGQDSQTKKSQSGNPPIWGEAPTVPIRTKICMVCSLPDTITCAKFQVEIFRGYLFTGGRISHFPIDLCTAKLQQCSATALPVIITSGKFSKKYGTSRNFSATS